ncbi:MAG TPA: TraB/GumN family protein [Casimicrobiaceae bacterium]|jgi:uncharacterized protein YbaP (TraB family)|nr:TraB/GumN family protein [Casimicrobiaceae bacterium]
MSGSLTASRAALIFALGVVLRASAGTAQPFEHGLLWRLEKPGAAPSWVYGTLHSSDPRVTALPAPVAGAFAAARSFAMEIYLTDVEGAAFAEATQFDDGRRLAPLLGEDAYGRLRELLGASAPPEEVLARTKPWAALLRIDAARARSDGPTLDRRLYLSARERRMTILGLEDLDEQVAALDSIPMPTQVAIVKHTLDHLSEIEAQAEPAIRAWLARDLAALADINAKIAGRDAELARHYAALTHALIENRSVLMAHRLFLPLARGGVFVAVGALHLYGRKGLLALLSAQGYRVRRVY